MRWVRRPAMRIRSFNLRRATNHESLVSGDRSVIQRLEPFSDRTPDRGLGLWQPMWARKGSAPIGVVKLLGC